MRTMDSAENGATPVKDLRRIYGHGQCASLALAVLEHARLPCVVFYGAGEDDGAFHVANEFMDKYLDVYGVVTQADMETRYGAPLTMRRDPDGSQARIEFEVCMSEFGDDDKDPEGTGLAWNDCGKLMLGIIAKHENELVPSPVKKRGAGVM